MQKHKAFVFLALLPLVASAQTSIYSTNFSTGERATTNAAYDVGDWTLASTKNTTGISYATGAFSFGMAATTSGLVEAQSRFSTSSTTLSTVGDWIQLKVQFTNPTAGNLLAGGTSSTINIGLYDSGGNNPTAILAASGLTATNGSGSSTGNAQTWEGYVGRIALTGGANSIFTRPSQVSDLTESSSENQELLFSNVGNGAFDYPAGVQLGTTATSTQPALSAATSYQAVLRITLTGASEYTVDTSLFNGVGDTTLQTISRSTVGGSFLNSLAFDGIAFGYRQSGTSVINAITLNSVDITVSTVPEPSTCAALAGAVGLGMVAVRRRRRA